MARTNNASAMKSAATPTSVTIIKMTKVFMPSSSRSADHARRAVGTGRGVLLDSGHCPRRPHRRIQNLGDEVVGPREQRNLDGVVRHLLTGSPDGRRAALICLTVLRIRVSSTATTTTTTK